MEKKEAAAALLSISEEKFYEDAHLDSYTAVQQALGELVEENFRMKRGVCLQITEAGRNLVERCDGNVAKLAEAI